MPPIVVNGAMLKCSFGAAPASLIVLPANQVSAVNMPVATVMDFKPTANIPPFGMCSSPSNPVVITATAAAQGVLTPMPCVPAITAPWAPGSMKVKVKNQAVVLSTCMANCMWAGVITVANPGQTKVVAQG